MTESLILSLCLHSSMFFTKKEKTPSPTPEKTTIDKKIEETPTLDDDIIEVLRITDDLLAKLPDDVIENFAKSKNFELYEKVLNKYKIK